jgi:hypothetical protein
MRRRQQGRALLKTLRGDRSNGEASVKLSQKNLTADPSMKRSRTSSEVKIEAATAIKKIAVCEGAII